ncbi:MAG TPA: hypothetical protein DDY98_01765 [Ruminococcaceae bacterium]|nr:hypothetical protein [Oscillospiraceae bacterium]
MKKNRRKIGFVLLVVLAALALVLGVTFVPHGVFQNNLMQKPNSFSGSSEIFEKDDLTAAAQAVENELNGFEGVKNILSIRYCGDETQTQANREYCEGLALSQSVTVDAFAVFEASFTTGQNTQSLNSNDVYTGFTFYLARRNGGNWVVLTCGYA